MTKTDGAFKAKENDPSWKNRSVRMNIKMINVLIHEKSFLPDLTAPIIMLCMVCYVYKSKNVIIKQG